MKEIFRHSELHRVTRYRDILESAGIETLVRNEALSVSDAPIPEFFPNLCVLSDDEFPRASELLKEHDERMAAGSGVEVICPPCGEVNPGNFDVFFNCQEPMPHSMPC
jgi:hypothetical protein|tara:strand:- start:5052 stop:5375 length:324 start_codon:yes stop_codon:yes gene_type:complete